MSQNYGLQHVYSIFKLDQGINGNGQLYLYGNREFPFNTPPLEIDKQLEFHEGSIEELMKTIPVEHKNGVRNSVKQLTNGKSEIKVYFMI